MGLLCSLLWCTIMVVQHDAWKVLLHRCLELVLHQCLRVVMVVLMHHQKISVPLKLH